MAQTIGSIDLNAFSDLYSDSNQYFWFESNASATYGAGAHVTLVPDTSFISNPTGQNILMNTDGFSIRNGLLPMMTLDNDSLEFNVVDTTAGTYTTTATFTSTGAQIGQAGKPRITLNDSQIDIYDDSSIPRITVKTDGIYFWRNQGSLLFLNAGEAWNDVCLNGDKYCGAVLGMPKGEMLGINTTSGAHVAVTPKNVSGREPYVRFMLKTSDLDDEYYSVLKYGMYQDTTQGTISTYTVLDVDGEIQATGEVHGTLANPIISITASTGTLQSATVYRQGNVVQLLVSVRKTSATASGREVFEGTINTTALRPKMITTSGTYYGSHALNATISTSGVITIRNADSRQLDAMTVNGNISFTYLID